MSPPVVKQKWMEFIARDPNGNGTHGEMMFEKKTTPKICSDHFDPACFNKHTIRKKLAANSIPTIYPVPKLKDDGSEVKIKLSSRSPNLRPRAESVVTPKGRRNTSENATERVLPASTPKGRSITSKNDAAETPRSRKRDRSSSSKINSPTCKKRTDEDSIEETPSVLFNSSLSPCTRSGNQSFISEHEISLISSIQKPEVASKNCTTPKRQYKHDHSYSFSQLGDTPRRCKEKYDALNDKVNNQSKKIKSLQTTVCKLKKSVRSMAEVLKDLKSKEFLSENAQMLLENYFSGAPLELFQRVVKNNESGKKCRNEYPPELRAFALTLHFHSTAAYNYVRDTFNLALPDVSTLRSWYSEVDAGVGFCREAFDNLKSKAEECKYNNLLPPRVALILDEMHLKKYISFTGTEFSGLVDLGTSLDPEGLDRPVATEALVFMVVCLNSNWKLPVAHFFTNGLTGKEKANLINECLIRLQEVGVTVESLTCDGPTVNFSMCEKLGANLDLDKLQCHFLHPSSGHKIQIMLDPCHMIKLIRNTLEAKKILYNSKNEKIEWKYIALLHELQEKEKLRAGNKLRKKHLQFRRQIMKVNLAVQTLSSSVADAIEFCNRDMNNSEFKDSPPTVEFIRIVDRAFDHLNSRNPYGKGLKAPLQQHNEADWRPFFQNAMDYIYGLKIMKNEQLIPLYKSPCRTGFIGLYTGLFSVRDMYDRLCSGEDPKLKYLLTYKFSQDHLELFFGAIRARGGWNNNPTCQGFTSAFKRLLIRNEIRSGRGNITAQDATTILFVKQKKKENKGKKAIKRPTNVDLDKIDLSDAKKLTTTMSSTTSGNIDSTCDNSTEISDEEYICMLNREESLTLFAQNIVAYIAGKTALMVNKQCNCNVCSEALTAPKLDHNHIPTEKDKNMSRLTLLLRKKQRWFNIAKRGCH
ncbi:hypothetical protein B566_EDAN014125 [Ephemera danica]|nr:hypothetical protein B566_EDAN014125 [Ephemera danica]